jgi:O-antigen/teichoic acid export membrane protein
MTGTTIAQAIPIAISPILTRLYSPKDFGVLALFVAITSIFGSIANGRYELAIMLPKKDEDAINIVALGVFIVLCLSSVLLIVVVLFHDLILELLDNEQISTWLYFVPMVVLLVGLYNVLNYYNNRLKNYKDLAQATIIKSIASATIQLVLGFMKAGVSGLISGQIISQFFANMKLLKNITKDKALISKVSKIKIIALARRYKDFPKFTLWAGLLNTSSTQLTNILISSMFSIKTLGFYSLTQRLLAMPSALIGSSIQQVLFQEASSEKQRTEKINLAFFSALKKLAIISFPFFLILYFIVEDLFAFVFGQEWRVAGTYAKILIPLFTIRFIVSPLTILNQVNRKNKLGMQWQIGLLFLYMSILYISNNFSLNFLITIKLISMIISGYYLFFLYLIYNHAKETNE